MKAITPKTTSENRNIWVDNIKVFACVLVVLGHFFKSMVASQMISESYLYHWFVDTIYYFHVPLFFVCSGYLYQKYSCVNSFGSWGCNAFKKLVNLGIPYFVFSAITWILKNVFSGDVNIQNNAGLLKTLLNQPLSPYWYLYTLMFIFLLTPTFSNKKMAFGSMVVAVAFKFIYIFIGEASVYAVSSVLSNEIWFVLGMALAFFEKPAWLQGGKWKGIGVFGTIAFVSVSLLISWYKLETEWLSFVMGVWGCIVFLLVFMNFLFMDKCLRWLRGYTMPIFLMHTIFAAGLRSVLFRLGIEHMWIHLVLGMAISMIGPIVAAMVMQPMRLDILYTPGKYIRFKKRKVNGNG